MQSYISQLESDFMLNSDSLIAKKQSAYLKDKFELFGIPTPLRKEIQKPFLMKVNLPPKEGLTSIMTDLWKKPQREFQYFALDLHRKYIKKLEREDIKLLEFMIVEKSWWDTVDLIASNLVGGYFNLFPEQIETITNTWMKSDNLWLQRSCLLFQLKYKDKINTELLSRFIQPLLGSNEFFINKAIGWILREYTRTNPDWVVHFVESNELSNLSKREALKLLNN